MSLYDHSVAPKVGVLIVNTGTPDAPTKQALRPYLKQFLSDPRIVDTPRWLWWLILNGIILNTRPKKSAQGYQRVWTDRGSPLAFHTQDQAEGIRQQLADTWGDSLIIEWAMRYGQPSVASKLEALQQQGVEKLVVLPLFPQYASATTASIYDAVGQFFKDRLWLPEIHFINQYFDHPLYINALADSVTQHWQQHGRPDKLIFSYHGEPLRYLHRGDPYHCQCLKTTRLVAEKLDLAENDYLTSFQSRFGPGDWLQPYTDETLKSLPEKNIKYVQVLCPGFAADCLETVDEIAIENKHYFINAGGERFDYIPALNASTTHIDVLTAIVQNAIQGWSSVKQVSRSQTQTLFDRQSFNKN
jgi:ferrochelatase